MEEGKAGWSCLLFSEWVRQLQWSKDSHLSVDPGEFVPSPTQQRLGAGYTGM